MRRAGRPSLAAPAVLQLLERCEQLAPPVDLEALAAELGIVITRRRLNPSTAGLLVRMKGRSVVILARQDDRTRARCTLARAVARVLLEPDLEEAYRIERRPGGADRQLGHATAELLMPARLLEEALDLEPGAQLGAWDDDETVHRLAQRFDVAPPAMGLRLQALGRLV